MNSHWLKLNNFNKREVRIGTVRIFFPGSIFDKLYRYVYRLFKYRSYQYIVVLSQPYLTLSPWTYRVGPIWLKSDLYLCYCIEDLITRHYWSLYWLIYRYFYLTESISEAEALTFWSESTTCPDVTRKRNNKRTYIILKNTALRLKYAFWLV